MNKPMTIVQNFTAGPDGELAKAAAKAAMPKQHLTKGAGPSGFVKIAPDGTGEGTVLVAFAQLNVSDHDGDYTIPGAFQIGQKLKVCQTGHAHYQRVAGAGEIVGEEQIDGGVWAVASLKFFLDTEAGREEFATVKALSESGHSQEWSYGYDILDAEQSIVDGERVQILKSLSVYEISPVLRGAGIGTHTLAVKAKDGECETCGQALPKNADEKAAAVCDDCGEAIEDCTCEKTREAAATAKRQAAEALASFELTRARLLGVQIE